MALLRAEIRNRLGEHSIYDGIVEYQNDFQTEPMLASMHYGSMMLCLNYSDNQSENDEEIASDLYVKRIDGTWEFVTTVTAGKQGEDGTTFTPSVSASGVLSWTNDDGKENPQSVDLVQALVNSGAIEPYYVTFTVSQSGVWSADRNIAEATAAINAGKTVLFVYDDCISLTTRGNDAGSNYILGTVVDRESDGSNQYDLYLLDGVGATAVKVGLAERERIVTSSSASVEIMKPKDNTVYKCGTLTALTISNTPASGKFSIIFTSGATPTVVTGIDNFTAEANTRYRINVEDRYATLDSWAVSGV